jgi:hypothetical protein
MVSVTALEQAIETLYGQDAVGLINKAYEALHAAEARGFDAGVKLAVEAAIDELEASEEETFYDGWNYGYEHGKKVAAEAEHFLSGSAQALAQEQRELMDSDAWVADAQAVLDEALADACRTGVSITRVDPVDFYEDLREGRTS